MTKQAKNKTQNHNDSIADVLYQRLGDRVYAFSVINDEVYFGSIAAADLNRNPSAGFSAGATASHAADSTSSNPELSEPLDLENYSSTQPFLKEI